MKRQILAAVLVLVLVLSFAACGSNTETAEETAVEPAAETTETAEETTEEAEPAAEATEEAEPAEEPEEEAAKAFLYNWDGSGERGSDLYFNVNIGGTTYQFTVESYLCGQDTEVYQAVEALQVGDTIDLEGFLYYYNGINPHITMVAPAGTAAASEAVGTADTEKGEGVMTYAEYAAADVDTEVTVECYVQAHQSWWDNTITVYAQDAEGGYFFYNMACSEEDAEKLVPGTKIKVTGYKSEWSGEVEIVDATFEIEEGSYIAAATDITAVVGTDAQDAYANMLVAFKGAVVEAIG